MKKCKKCGKESEEDFCQDCQSMINEGYLDKCECGNYKEKEYELCDKCYKKRKPYKDLSGEHKVPRKKKS